MLSVGAMLWLWFGMLEIRGTAKWHAFIVGDKAHPQAEKIRTMLNSLAKQMEEGGYVADTNFVLDEMEEEAEFEIMSRGETRGQQAKKVLRHVEMEEVEDEGI